MKNLSFVSHIDFAQCEGGAERSHSPGDTRHDRSSTEPFPTEHNRSMNIDLILSTIAFLLAATGIWQCGGRLTAYADEISDRTRIGKAFMGFVFLAAATELPELVTTLTASVGNNAGLALNNMFGGVALQTALLVAADIIARGAPLTFYPRRPTAMLSATALVFLLVMLMVVITLGERTLWGHVGIGSVVLAVAYGVIVFHLRRQETNDAPWMPVTVPEAGTDQEHSWVSSFPTLSDSGLTLRFALMAMAILVLGLILVETSERIAHLSGLGSSFIGATLLAGSTSLPELSTTIAAVRLRSYTMAIANIFGSNLIMLALILPADIAYAPGPILTAADKTAQFAILAGIVVTVIYLYGLMARSRRQVWGMGLDSLAVAIAYGAALIVFWALAG